MGIAYWMERMIFGKGGVGVELVRKYVRMWLVVVFDMASMGVGVGVGEEN